MTRGATDGRCLGDASGASSPALGASPTSVSHGHDGRSHANSGRKIPAHPYQTRQMSGFGFRQTLEVRTLWCTRRFNPLPTCSSPNRKVLNYQTEQHKRHKVYTGSGHHCGVKPFSSLWCGGLPLGLMMNNTRKNSLAMVCSWLVLLGSGSSILDQVSSLLPRGWLVLFIGKGPGPLPKY